jgi:NAD(P)-dependent dehydrogenase (short-subunit alcohol dehydrogenase family)
MAVDLAKYRISVNAVAPGWVVTPMTENELEGMPESAYAVINPLLRAAQPEEIAGVVRYLALDAPDFLTGSTLFVDGGQTAQAAVPA